MVPRGTACGRNTRWSINTYGTRREGRGASPPAAPDRIEYTALLGGGYDWQHAEWSFGPQVVVQYMAASIDAFDETGSMAPMHIESQSDDSLHTQLGADLHCRHYIEPTLTFVTPEISIAWQHEYLTPASRLNPAWPAVPAMYSPSTGQDLGSDSIIMSLGFTIQWKPTVSTYFHYTMQTVMQSRGYEANAIDAGMRINF